MPTNSAEFNSSPKSLRPGRGWRTEHFLSAPALLALAAAIAVFAGAIVTASVRPAPYGESEFITEYHRDIPALTFSQVVPAIHRGARMVQDVFQAHTPSFTKKPVIGILAASGEFC